MDAGTGCGRELRRIPWPRRADDEWTRGRDADANLEEFVGRVVRTMTGRGDGMRMVLKWDASWTISEWGYGMRTVLRVHLPDDMRTL